MAFFNRMLRGFNRNNIHFDESDDYDDYDDYTDSDEYYYDNYDDNSFNNDNEFFDQNDKFDYNHSPKRRGRRFHRHREPHEHIKRDDKKHCVTCSCFSPPPQNSFVREYDENSSSIITTDMLLKNQDMVPNKLIPLKDEDGIFFFKDEDGKLYKCIEIILPEEEEDDNDNVVLSKKDLNEIKDQLKRISNIEKKIEEINKNNISDVVILDEDKVSIKKDEYEKMKTYVTKVEELEKKLQELTLSKQNKSDIINLF